VKEADALEILRHYLVFVDPCMLAKLTGKALSQSFNVLSILIEVEE